MATKQEQSNSKTLNIVLVIVGIIAVLIFMGVIGFSRQMGRYILSSLVCGMEYAYANN